MIQIYGYSDDLVEVEGDVSDEYSVYDRAAWLRIDDPVDGTSVIITGEYGKHSAVWTFSVEPVGDGVPMMPVKILAHENGYSPLLTIECSANATVRWVHYE